MTAEDKDGLPQRPHWHPIDEWHRVTSRTIRKYVDHLLLQSEAADALTLLNLGSGGVQFGRSSWRHIHLDLDPFSIRNQRLAIAGDIGDLPLRSSIADVSLCVGQVLNLHFGDLPMSELRRVGRMGSRLILEFESSRSLEYQLRRTRETATVSTFYGGGTVRIRVYSPYFVIKRLQSAGFMIEFYKTFHIISSLALRFTGDPEFSARFAVLDPVLARFPALRMRGCNVIIAARLDS